MPLYEYQCTQCGQTTEVLQKAKDKPLERCPKCGGRLVKLVSSPAIQFKGNGWYITDYARKKPPAAEAKPEPKPAAGPDAKPDKSSS